MELLSCNRMRAVLGLQHLEWRTSKAYSHSAPRSSISHRQHRHHSKATLGGGGDGSGRRPWGGQRLRRAHGDVLPTKCAADKTVGSCLGCGEVASCARQNIQHVFPKAGPECLLGKSSNAPRCALPPVYASSFSSDCEPMIFGIRCAHVAVHSWVHFQQLRREQEPLRGTPARCRRRQQGPTEPP